MINIVVALRAEARPLIERLGLSRVENAPIPRLFEGTGVALAISGIGKMASAAAVAGLANLYGDRSSNGWINVGLAGHRCARLGEAFRADVVRDDATGAEWRLPPTCESRFDAATIVTVDRPELDYPEKVLYDMEAAGFVAAAGSLAGGLDRLRVIKVVSDNANRSVEHVTATVAAELIDGHVRAIAELTQALRDAT